MGEVFSCKESLSISFQKTEKSNSPLTALLERAPDTLLRPPADMNKEAVRSLQGEDKDEDSSDPSPTVPNNDDTSVDLPSVRRAFEALWSLPGIKIYTTKYSSKYLFKYSLRRILFDIQVFFYITKIEQSYTIYIHSLIYVTKIQLNVSLYNQFDILLA